MRKKNKGGIFLILLLSITSLHQPTLVYAMMDDFKEKGNSQSLPHKGHSHITTSNKPLISKEDENSFKVTICQKLSVNPETCEKFLKGKLIYKPNKDNDEGKIELRIADLANPLNGTFDLSQCGNSRQYIRIATGFQNEENPNNVEIWFAPRFLIEKYFNGNAAYLQYFTEKLNSDQDPVVLFYSWGDGRRW